MCIFELLHQFAEWLKPFADIFVGIGTVALAYFTFRVVTATKKLAEGAQADSAKQLSVQVWLDFSKQFDSEKVKKSRRRLAEAETGRRTFASMYVPPRPASNFQIQGGLLSNDLLSFFEDLGNVHCQGLIHKELTKEAFGYHVRRWWIILKDDIYKLREQRGKGQGAETKLFDKFEKLDKALILSDFKIVDTDIAQFIKDELDA